MDDLDNPPMPKLVMFGVLGFIIVGAIIYFMMDTTGGVSPGGPIARTPNITYSFAQGKDSSKNNIEHRSDLADNVPGLKAWCAAHPDCKGFNTNGWMKNKILPQNKWVTWTEDPARGLYVKN